MESTILAEKACGRSIEEDRFAHHLTCNGRSQVLIVEAKVEVYRHHVPMTGRCLFTSVWKNQCQYHYLVEKELRFNGHSICGHLPSKAIKFDDVSL